MSSGWVLGIRGTAARARGAWAWGRRGVIRAAVAAAGGGGGGADFGAAVVWSPISSHRRSIIKIRIKFQAVLSGIYDIPFTVGSTAHTTRDTRGTSRGGRPPQHDNIYHTIYVFIYCLLFIVCVYSV